MTYIESVLCVRGTIANALEASGLVEVREARIYELIQEAELLFEGRRDAESNFSLRQIIPYIILRYGDRFACYRRSSKGGEVRLHGAWSIGFGGHVNYSDAVFSRGTLDLSATLTAAAKREVNEEVGIAEVMKRDTVGIILDDSNDVGRVHLGLVQLWTLARPSVHPKEDKISDCGFCSWSEIWSRSAEMEGWSRLCGIALRKWAAP